MLNTEFTRILHVDLTRGATCVEDRADLFGETLGGTGTAMRLLGEMVRDDLDPLDPAQPIIFAIGPLTTIFPVVTKAVATFRSPLTGEYGESHAGGQFSSALRYAGYDALVITGASSPLGAMASKGGQESLFSMPP